MNKEILIENNSKLEEAIIAIQSLPIENIWEGSEIIIPSTESITIPAYTNKELTVSAIEQVDTLKDFFGYEKISTGQIRPRGNSEEITINHGLNSIPKLIIIYTQSELRTTSGNDDSIKMIIAMERQEDEVGIYDNVFFETFIQYNTDDYKYSGNTGGVLVSDITTKKMTINSGYNFFVSSIYKWVVMA